MIQPSGGIAREAGVSSAPTMPRLRFLYLLIAVLAVSACSDRVEEEGDLLLVTTTSVRDSGLLAELLPIFQERTGVRPQVVAVGSGAALRMGRDGNADVLLTHAPEGEESLVASGAAASRVPFMENHFVIAGPSEDPAGVREASSPADAIRRIADASARFVSRGDDSGTHRREVALLKEAGLDPSDRWPGFLSSGAGMGQSLQIAGEKRTYILSDVGTFLAFQKRIELEVLSQPAPSLRNVYSVLRVNPDKLEPVRAERAEQFEAFLLDIEIQRQIAEFGRERFGRPLFRPLHLEQRPGS
jgi:tungstate transport system substrate-binding protein